MNRGAVWLVRNAAQVAREWRRQARQGIRWSGTVVVATALAVSAWLHLGIPYEAPLFVGFLFTSVNHLAAVWMVDRGGPLPRCTACVIPLNVGGYVCGNCKTRFPAA